MKSEIVVIMAVVSLAFFDELPADIIVETTVGQRFDDADLVVLGSVERKRARRGLLVDRWVVAKPDRTLDYEIDEYEYILTDFEIAVSHAFKTPLDQSLLTVTTRGGKLDDGTEKVFFQKIHLDVGQEALFFLYWDDDNNWYTPNNGPDGIHVLERDESEGDSPVFRTLFEGSRVVDLEGSGSLPQVDGLSRDAVIEALSQLEAQRKTAP